MDIVTDHMPAITAPRRTVFERGGRLVDQMLRDSAYTFVQFPLATASFVALVTGLSLAAGMMILVVGLPLLVAALGVARLFAAAQRQLVGLRGHGTLHGTYRRSRTGPWWKRMLATVRTPQPWLDTLHGLVAFPVATFTFVVATVWWSVTLGGLTFWIWGRFIPEGDPSENTTLPELLHWNVPEWVLYLLLGLVALATLAPLMRLCASMHEALARLLLDNERVRELEAQVRELDAARDAATHAELQSLRRLERDLHDGPQQRLVRLGMDLAVAERRLDTEPEAARQLVSEARALAAETLGELRALSRGIAPPILVDRGLHAALVAMAARSPVPATVDVDLPSGLTLAEPVDTALYFAVSEAMANVAKHSGASQAAISIHYDGRAAIAEVADNGAGGAVVVPGHGLSGLVDRLAALHGTLTVDSPAGGPTRVVARIPCGS